MQVYVITLFLVFILSSLEYQSRVDECRINSSQIQLNKVFWYGLIIVFLVVGGLRFRVGTDYVAYAGGYIATFSEIKQKIITFDEPIIYIITYVARRIWDDGVWVIFVENALIIFLVFKGLKSYEKDSYTLPLLLYILYCGWTSSFNGIRQSLAVAFIFAFSKRNQSKLWIVKYIIVVFFAFLIHKSAIFMFPILILSNRKIDFKQMIYACISAVIMYKMGGYALEFMNTSIDTEYAIHSVNVLRVVVATIPAILSLCCSSEFREENKFLVNMAMFNALITITTRHSALMYRFSDYTNIYLMILIPKCEMLFTEKNQILFKWIVVVLFFAYFWYEVNSGNGKLNDFQWVFGNLGIY